MGDFLSPEIPKLYVCKDCDYSSVNKKDFKKHLETIKHKKRTNGDQMVTMGDHFGDLSQNTGFECTCGKKYKFKQGLSRHKKKCENNDDQIVESSAISSDLVIKLITENNDFKNTLIKENQELRKQIHEQSQQISEMIPKIGNNNNNNIKQKFNINVFLNEECKNAINMKEFIKSITVSLEQLDYTKTHGLSSGLSNLFIENMNKLPINERPVHCTDTKRETLYIKEDDTWEKDKDKTKIKKAIKSASGKNYQALKDWQETNPDYMENDDKKDYFVHVISTIGKPTEGVDDKIIRNICKETYVKE